MSESALDRERKAHQQTRDAAQRQILELQQQIRLKDQFLTTAMNEIRVAYPEGLPYLIDVLNQERAAAHPLRGAPSFDTMRVGHPELTSVEAAADKGPSQRQKRWDQRIKRLAESLDDELGGSQEKKPVQPRKPRCQRRGCNAYDKSLPYGSKVCSVCQEPVGEAA